MAWRNSSTVMAGTVNELFSTLLVLMTSHLKLIRYGASILSKLLSPSLHDSSLKSTPDVSGSKPFLLFAFHLWLRPGSSFDLDHQEREQMLFLLHLYRLWSAPIKMVFPSTNKSCSLDFEETLHGKLPRLGFLMFLHVATD